MVNFYELLGINSNATTDEINKAYRKKSMEFHPDKHNGSAPADAMFKMITLAKDTLLNPFKRLEHDYNVGIKKRPEPAPKVIKVEVPVEKTRTVVKKESDVGAIVGWGLLALIAGIALGSGSGGSKKA
ncbi:MAG: J domain-containing protein [Bacteroidota bacterium]